MNDRPSPTRRALLRGGLALSSLALAQRLGGIELLSSARAQASSDYKALVCVFLFGGNDGNNTLVPLDAARYAQYAAVRTSASGIQLAQTALLPVQPSSTAEPYGLHPSLTELKGLFDARKLALVANVGSLGQPTSRDQYKSGVRPLSLYSHSDQQAQWQSAVANAPSATGWGGRVADRMQPRNAASGFPVITSLGGTVLFATGGASAPLTVPVTGAFALAGFSSSAASNARLAAMNALLAEDATNVFAQAGNAIGTQAMKLSTTVNPILTGTSSTVNPIFSGLNTNTGRQLLRVARLIEARATTGAARQIFFVQLGGFDTHSDQARRQDALFRELSPALKAFYDATVALGVASNVTTFTLSDFGRTFAPASGGGTDHAWGSHHFVLGDAVRGGDLYGRYPELVLAGADDAEREGRWIPTTAVDQYGATLARWFGVGDAELDGVFPNLARFASRDVGFMA